MFNRTFYIHYMICYIFLKSLLFDFPEKRCEKRIIVILDFSFQLPCQAKLLDFVLWSKILLTNQIAGFLKDFMKELKHEVNFVCG